MSRVGVSPPGLKIAFLAVFAVLLGIALPAVHLYRVGVMLIFFLAALGLHVLFNWTGEASLATASTLGLCTLAVTQLSAVTNVNPILLVPVGAVLGGVIGLIMAVAALRAKGIYVVIVTLSVSTVISTFFFNESWLVGSGTVVASATKVLGMSLSTPEELWPALIAWIVVAAGATHLLLRSDYGRSLLLVRHKPLAATVRGINVPLYRASAYVLGSALTGLAGGLTAMWVQAASPLDFSQTVSTSYLVAVVLAGPGSMFGLFELSIFTVGLQLYVSSSGPVITYLGPVALMLTLVRFPGGINQQNAIMARAVRRMLHRVRDRGRRSAQSRDSATASDLHGSEADCPAAHAVADYAALDNERE